MSKMVNITETWLNLADQDLEVCNSGLEVELGRYCLV